MYQVIARKYRPQNFSQLIGQEHVRRTLSNALERGRIAHGYIFSGQRGTGKTTVARILASCLNCIQGPTPNPCGVCSSCVEIRAGNSVDVIEIDAASNRGINEMREIRENVRYRPARDPYKIFIVDEAHQITKEAFNALLKTLEEPPEWTVFILCTTEAYEIPNTIASRCQHFTFRSVDFGEIVERMKFIAAQEGIEASEEVLSLVARAGEGSVRDSLSALDQAIACCGTTLNADEIRGLLGLFALDSLRAVADAVLAEDGARMLAIVQDLEETGQSLQHFSRELSRYWRNLLVARISGKPTRLIPATDHEQTALLETAGRFTEEDLTRYLNFSLAFYQELQESLQPRLHLELGLIKLVQVGRLRSIEEALDSLGPAPSEPLPLRRESSPSTAKTPAITAETRASTQRPPAFQVPATRPPTPAAQTVDTATVKSRDLKQDLYQALMKAGSSFTADAILQAEVNLEGSELSVCAPAAAVMALKDASFERAASQFLGRHVRIKVEAGQGLTAAPPSTPPGAPSDDLRERALSHPGVKRFQELFPEAHIRTVRNLNE